MPSMKKKRDPLLPLVNEPMVDYLASKRYKDSLKTITISSFEEQENDNYRFWAHLTPAQRIELHYLMISTFFKDVLESPEKDCKIELTEDSWII
jgi:hypothetical protein